VLEHGVETGIDPALYLLVDQSLDLGQHTIIVSAISK
jgi:hypothetical protein